MNKFVTQNDIDQEFSLFAEKMIKEGLPHELISLFGSYYNKILHQSSHFLYEKDIEPVSPEELDSVQDLSGQMAEKGNLALDQTVIIKLNGGLGTSMGMPHAKSLLKVKDDLTFLDITLQQARGCNKSQSAQMPLVLMNSFKTHEDTGKYLQSKGLPQSKWPKMFLQHKYPKIHQHDLSPASWPENPELEWNPPGHGDLYAALFTSGVLEELLRQGKQYAFVSNADNLGAVIDPAILGYFAHGEYPFMMEVARRTPADTKGGHLARLKDGKLTLREIAQCPEKDLDSFQDIEQYSFFNTNNIWLNLKLLKAYIDNYGLPQLPLILNPKTLNPRDENSPEIYQVETAMGAAISCFDRAAALQVPRSRFIPVKKTNDLLLVRSDCYFLDNNCKLQLSPDIEKDPPKIELDSKYYKKIDQLDARFPWGPPSLKEARSFVVKGDVFFEDEVICQNEVSVENSTYKQAVITRGSILKGRINFS